MNDDGRILVHFSCGAASAVAAKITCTAYAKTRNVEVINFDLSHDEHPDNQRFLADIERWIEQPIIRLNNPKYRTVEEVWRGERYIVGPAGASCTRCLKREVGKAYERPTDTHVIGFTADEPTRIRDIEAYMPDMRFLWVLAMGGITKEDCYHILSNAGIELPAMYKLGFNHNNCIGCCKGGKGYWNKVREHFPEIFERRAKIQRELGVAFHNGSGLWFLDELKPGEGRDVPEPPIECGLMCGHYETLVDLAARRLEQRVGQPVEGTR